MELTDIRERIDALDGEIISLLSKRAGLVSAAGRFKNDVTGVQDPKRVEQVIAKVTAKAMTAGLDPVIAEEIYRTIIGCFVRKELKEFIRRAQPTLEANIDCLIRKAADSDRDAITVIFNHYVEHSFAAYPDQRVDRTFFDFLKKIIYGDSFFVMASGEGTIVGFGFLKRYHPHPVFNRVAEIGYFILPDYTRRGLGARLLDALENEATALGIDTLLANISSHNEASLAFHNKQGFQECGRFKKVSRKFGQDVDMVWMQKFL